MISPRAASVLGGDSCQSHSARSQKPGTTDERPVQQSRRFAVALLDHAHGVDDEDCAGQSLEQTREMLTEAFLLLEFGQALGLGLPELARQYRDLALQLPVGFLQHSGLPVEDLKGVSELLCFE